MELTIRRALPSDALFLTSISFGAKRYWNYPEEYFEVWHNELTITEDYIEQNVVYVAQKKDTIIGYFSIVEVTEEYWNGSVFVNAGHWLDHIYIRPAYIRSGIGTELMDYAEEYCRQNGIELLYIFSDPFANGFYEKLGAIYMGDVPSSIQNRTVSLYEYYIPEKSRAQIEEELLLQRIHEEEERLRQEAEEERLRQEAEEERLRQEEEVERLRQEVEEAERLRQEAEEAERLRQEAEEVERLRQEAEEAERLRQEAEEAERLRQEAEEAERLRQEAEEAERLRQEAEEAERLRQEEEEAERLRQEVEEEERTARLIKEVENSRGAEATSGNSTVEQKRRTFFGIPIDAIRHRPIKLEHEKLNQKISELDQGFEDDFEDIQEIAEEASTYTVDHSSRYIADEDEYVEDEDQEYDSEEDEYLDNDYEDNDYEDDEFYEEDREQEDESSMNNREIQIPKLQLDEEEIAALIGPTVKAIDESAAAKEVHIRTEKEKMLAGELYIAWGDDFINDKRRARKLLREFNNTDVEDKKATTKLLKELFGATGEYIHIEPQFKCDYGYNIYIGDNFYASYDCVILDSCEVRIGNNCILSPQVGIYTSTYPLSANKRSIGYEYARPVTIGNNVWIGGGAIINPGVTIGDNVVVAPGSVVLEDIPDHMLVGGNPARIIKEIEVEK